MGAALVLRADYSGDDLRHLAREAKDAAQVRRLLSLAAVADGQSRGEAAAAGLMDRQTLRDWVIRFNAEGPDGLIAHTSSGRTPKLSAAQKQEVAALVEAGPEGVVPHLVRWRRIDLARVIKERFGITYHETSVGRILKELGFSHISPRPQHPKQDQAVIEAFKKTSPQN